jgi:hypothetical protein
VHIEFPNSYEKQVNKIFKEICGWVFEEICLSTGNFNLPFYLLSMVHLFERQNRTIDCKMEISARRHQTHSFERSKADVLNISYFRSRAQCLPESFIFSIAKTLIFVNSSQAQPSLTAHTPQPSSWSQKYFCRITVRLNL